MPPEVLQSSQASDGSRTADEALLEVFGFDLPHLSASSSATARAERRRTSSPPRPADVEPKAPEERVVAANEPVVPEKQPEPPRHENGPGPGSSHAAGPAAAESDEARQAPEPIDHIRSLLKKIAYYISIAALSREERSELDDILVQLRAVLAGGPDGDSTGRVNAGMVSVLMDSFGFGDINRP